MIESTRRDVLKSGLAAAGFGLLGSLQWTLPILARGEELVAFTDVPADFDPVPSDITRRLDIRTIDGPLTPAERFFTHQHDSHPVVDRATYRLRVSGLVDRPREYTLDEVIALGGADLRAGFECSGNSARAVQSLAGNGQWTGVPLQRVLRAAGVRADGLEIVFFGADRCEEDVDGHEQQSSIDQQFGRSLPRETAMAPEPFLAWALNDAPLSVHQGFPLRLIMPGWYGVANVKWLSRIHVQSERYLGKFQARWYRTVRGEAINGDVTWKESDISQMNLKSVVARVTKAETTCKVVGFVLNDGTPLKSVEIRVDDGEWQPATLDSTTSTPFQWKLFTFDWKNPAPGEHTLVSRASDIEGRVQPTLDELKNTLTFIEGNSQFPRKVLVA